MIRFEIPGRVVAKQSMRFTKSGHSFQPADVTNYHARCATFARMAINGAAIDGPCRLAVQIVLQTPRSWSKKRKARHNWCTTRPDLDNALKAICDGLKGIVFADDRQVVEATVRKSYGARDAVIVEVEDLATLPEVEAA